MKIKFEKKELAFLKDYVKVTDKEQVQYLTLVLNKANRSCTFQVLTSEVDMITTFEKEFDIDDDTVVNNYFLKDFVAFVNSCEGEFEFTGDKFIVNGGEYTINTYNDKAEVDIADVNGLEPKTIKLKNLDKITLVKNFMGVPDNIDHNDALLCKNGNYIAATDKYGGFFKSDNVDGEVDTYLTSKMISVLENLDSESASIFVYEDAGLVAIPSNNNSSIYIFKVNKKYDVPDVYEDEFVRFWNHSSKVTFNATDLRSVIDRIVALSDLEPDSILTRYTFLDGNIKLETFDGKAEQLIEAKVPVNLIGEVISLPVNYTQKVLKVFFGLEKSLGNTEMSMYLEPTNSEGEKVILVTFKNDMMPEFTTVVTRLNKDEY